MSKNTVEHIIRKFGSQQRVAELLGIWQTAVSGWVRRGAIPARRQEELLTLARREGVQLARRLQLSSSGRSMFQRLSSGSRPRNADASSWKWGAA